MEYFTDIEQASCINRCVRSRGIPGLYRESLGTSNWGPHKFRTLSARAQIRSVLGLIHSDLGQAICKLSTNPDIRKRCVRALVWTCVLYGIPSSYTSYNRPSKPGRFPDAWGPTHKNHKDQFLRLRKGRGRPHRILHGRTPSDTEKSPPHALPRSVVLYESGDSEKAARPKPMAATRKNKDNEEMSPGGSSLPSNPTFPSKRRTKEDEGISEAHIDWKKKPLSRTHIHTYPRLAPPQIFIRFTPISILVLIFRIITTPAQE